MTMALAIDLIYQLNLDNGLGGLSMERNVVRLFDIHKIRGIL